MDKVLVEIFVPVTNRSFEVFIPLCSRMSQVLVLIKKSINDMCEGMFIAGDDAIICFRESGAIININLSVYELGIRNGSKLMLI